MPSLITSDVAEKCLRSLLEKEGFELSKPKVNGQCGVDVVATKGNKRFHIEVVGYKSAGPARAKDFFEVFFRAISRLDDGATQCVIALPSRAGVGLPQRARQYRVGWQRIGEAFPELQIWLVDAENSTYTTHTWNEWLGE